MRGLFALAICCFGAPSAALTAKRMADSRLNVLMIVVDDQRPELNVYGRSPWMHTPNMDRLASSGLLLEQAHLEEWISTPSYYVSKLMISSNV